MVIAILKRRMFRFLPAMKARQPPRIAKEPRSPVWFPLNFRLRSRVMFGELARATLYGSEEFLVGF